MVFVVIIGTMGTSVGHCGHCAHRGRRWHRGHCGYFQQHGPIVIVVTVGTVVIECVVLGLSSIFRDVFGYVNI